MKLNFKNLPIGNLPYNDIELCKQMMLRLYENIPFLAELPLLDANDEIIKRTLDNIPGIKFEAKKLLFPEQNTNTMLKCLTLLDKAFNETDTALVNQLYSESPFLPMYIEMLKKIKPEYTVIRLLGAFSIAELVYNQNTVFLLSDKIYRKYIIQALTLKAIWYIKQIKLASKNTTPIILFEEPYLYKFGTYKRMNEGFSKDNIVTLFSKIFQKIQANGGLVGVHSSEKCNWQLVLDANVNMISFDAHVNTNSLTILSEKIKEFLQNGGYINWAIIPTSSENVIKTLNVDLISKKLKSAMDALSATGISIDAIRNNSTISIQGNLSDVPILFAEKALMITNQIAKKLPNNL